MSWALRTGEEWRGPLKLQTVADLMPGQEGPCLVSLGTVLGRLGPGGLGRGEVVFVSQGNVRGTLGSRLMADLLVSTMVSRLQATSCPLLSRNHLYGH